MKTELLAQQFVQPFQQAQATGTDWSKTLLVGALIGLVVLAGILGYLAFKKAVHGWRDLCKVIEDNLREIHAPQDLCDIFGELSQGDKRSAYNEIKMVLKAFSKKKDLPALFWPMVRHLVEKFYRTDEARKQELLDLLMMESGKKYAYNRTEMPNPALDVSFEAVPTIKYPNVQPQARFAHTQQVDVGAPPTVKARQQYEVEQVQTQTVPVTPATVQAPAANTVNVSPEQLVAAATSMPQQAAENMRRANG